VFQGENAMNRRKLFGCISIAFFAAALGGPCTRTLLARGDKVVPQVADAAGIIRTKLDISNLSSSTAIQRMKVFFYTKEGTPWVLATNLGTSSEFPVEIGGGQVLRVETLAHSGGPNSGYAIVRNLEGNAAESLDYQVSVSVFYEVLNNSRTVDTVAVSVGTPTLRWSFPVSIDSPKEIYSGFAIVNLANEPNTVTLQLWSSFPPSSAPASDAGRLTFTLYPREQRAQFLNEHGLFPDLAVFRGAVVGNASQPVAVAGLLQTQTSNGVQYATLAPAFLDAQRTESYVFLPETAHLDADVPTVPFSNTDDSRSFDLQHRIISPTVRYLHPANGAQLAAIGIRTSGEFETLAAADLQGLAYRAEPLDITDVSGNFAQGFTFGVRTSLGRLAKVRIAQIVPSGIRRDVVLQVYVYR
jgi:hypothetical protein